MLNFDFDTLDKAFNLISKFTIHDFKLTWQLFVKGLKRKLHRFIHVINISFKLGFCMCVLFFVLHHLKQSVLEWCIHGTLTIILLAWRINRPRTLLLRSRYQTSKHVTSTDFNSLRRFLRFLGFWRLFLRVLSFICNSFTFSYFILIVSLFEKSTYTRWLRLRCLLNIDLSFSRSLIRNDIYRLGLFIFWLFSCLHFWAHNDILS